MTLSPNDGGQLGPPGVAAENEAEPSSLPSLGMSIDVPDATDNVHTPPNQDAANSGYKSPLRHHQRNPSHHREVKETLNAHSEYTNNEEDGKAEHHLNQYVIKEEIGRGSFGAVHLAVDQYGTEYAVKEFSKSRLRKRAQSNILRRPHGAMMRGHLSGGNFNLPLSRHSASDIQNGEEQGNPLYLIREEIAIMKKLDHPNLVSLIEVLDDPEEDSLYMVLEMCKKGVIMKVGINAYERAEPYDVESCRCWFRDLILGIEYLHAQGVVHRDIKPDNLLITDDDILKIVDFGVSEMFEKSSEMLTNKSAGSPAFLPPELCVTNHGGISGKAADIWSMGVSLYCLRLGRIPFERSGVLDMYEAIKNDEVEFDSDCEPELVDLLKRVLDKNPKTRITMAEMREHSWVTKHGEDPLLSAEENTADLIEMPSDHEVKHAITTKMGNLMVLMKAVTKFKSLLEKKKSTESGYSSSKDVHRPHSTDGPSPESALYKLGRTSTNSLLSAEAVLSTGGSNPDVTASTSSSFGSRPVSVHGSATPRSLAASSRNNSERSNSGDSKLKHLQRILTASSDKSHAHDPSLDEPLYLGIGAGKNDLMGGADTLEVPEEDIIAESPQAAEFSIYDLAYEKEVERIRKAQGHEATVYLNRRVEGKPEYKAAAHIVPGSIGKSAFGQLLDRVREKENEKGSGSPSGT